MKRTHAFLLSVLAVLTLSSTSYSAESRHRDVTTPRNPILVESQIKEIARDGDAFVITLYRQPYAFVATQAATRVRIDKGDRIDVMELRPEDYIRLNGDLDHNTVYARQIIVLGRVEHRN